MAAARPYTPTSKTAMVEYIMLKDVNDTLADADELAELLRSHSDQLMVNLIPYNPTDATPEYQRATQQTTDRFMSTLRAAGILTSVRRTMGSDIAGACGQLVREQEKHFAAQRSDTATLPVSSPDIEDIGLTAPKGTGKVQKVRRATRLSSKVLHETPQLAEPASAMRRRWHFGAEALAAALFLLLFTVSLALIQHSAVHGF